jgi:hypothetical protein
MFVDIQRGKIRCNVLNLTIGNIRHDRVDSDRRPAWCLCNRFISRLLCTLQKMIMPMKLREKTQSESFVRLWRLLLFLQIFQRRTSERMTTSQKSEGNVLYRRTNLTSNSTRSFLVYVVHLLRRRSEDMLPLKHTPISVCCRTS